MADRLSTAARKRLEVRLSPLVVSGPKVCNRPDKASRELVGVGCVPTIGAFRLAVAIPTEWPARPSRRHEDTLRACQGYSTVGGFRFFLGKFLGIPLELLIAVYRAKMLRLAFVLAFGDCIFRPDVHSADRVSSHDKSLFGTNWNAGRHTSCLQAPLSTIVPMVHVLQVVCPGIDIVGGLQVWGSPPERNHS